MYNIFNVQCITLMNRIKRPESSPLRVIGSDGSGHIPGRLAVGMCGAIIRELIRGKYLGKINYIIRRAI